MRYWTKEEEQLLFTNMTNADIAAAIGRTIRAVEGKRHRMTGHSVEAERQRPNEKERYGGPEPTKILRICEMARRLGVKLFGEVKK